MNELKESVMPYRLLPHVYVRVMDTGTIWLDLKKDRYFGQSLEDVHGFSSFVSGWPDSTVNGEIQDRSPISVLIELEKAGLLTLAPDGKGADPASLSPSEYTLNDYECSARPTITHIACLLWSCRVVTLAQRRSLQYAVTRVTDRKSKARNHKHAEPLISKTIRLAKIFHKLRPLIYGAFEECLYDSFVLVDFLAWFHLFPTFVIGVQGAPFAAHSWVQQGAFVLNDLPTNVQRYQPILTV